MRSSPAGANGRYNLTMLRRIGSRPEWQIALLMAAGLRVFYTAVAALYSPFLHPDPVAIHSNALTDHLPTPQGLQYALLGIWERFDTIWFLHIARHGYDLPMGVIFYPLYPAAIRGVSALLPPVAAALAISTTAAFFLFWGLLRLARGATETIRMRTLLLYCVWPTSFVLFAGYSDSLTIALVVWAVVFGREERWALATLCGMLAGAARPTGVLVFIPLAILALRSRQLRSAIVCLTPLGWFGYWAWLRLSGRDSVVEAYRLYQGMTMVPPWTGLMEAVRLIVTQRDGLLAIKLAMVLGAAVITLRRRSNLRIEDRAFALVALLQMLMYTGRPLLGAPRYMLLVYPVFLVLGAYAERWNRKQLVFYIVAPGILNLIWLWAFMDWSLVL